MKFFVNLKEPLKNSDMWRCSKFWFLARRAIAAISVAISKREHNAAKNQKMRNPMGVRQLGGWLRRSFVTAPLRGCASLASCHPSQLPFAPRIIVFQRLLKQILFSFGFGSCLGEEYASKRHFVPYLSTFGGW